MASGSVSGVTIASFAVSGGPASGSASGRSIAFGSSAMMTIVKSRMKSKAPVSLVTTTATNESSPDPPNSRPACPFRRDRRIRLPPRPAAAGRRPGFGFGFGFARSGDLHRIAAVAAEAVVEHFLDDVAIEGVALLHADIEHVE